MAKPDPIKQIGGSTFKPIEIAPPKSTLPKPPTAYDPGRQVAGYERRFEASGIDTDSRNFFEKFTNLTPDQNWFWDVWELYDRSTRAVASGIGALADVGRRISSDEYKQEFLLENLAKTIQLKNEGKSTAGAIARTSLGAIGDFLGTTALEVGEGALAGFTGEERRTFSNVVATTLGIEENIATQLIGFALEVRADPLDMIKVTKGIAAVDDVVRSTGKFGDWLRVGRNADELLIKVGPEVATTTDGLIDVVKQGRQAEKIIRTGGEASAEVVLAYNKYKKVVKEMVTNTNVFADLSDYKSINQIIFGTVGKGVGKVVKVSDNLLVRGLTIVDESGGAAQTWGQAKKGVAKMFTRLASMSDDTLAKVRRSIGLEALSKRKMKASWDDTMMPIINDISKQYGLTKDEVYEQALTYVEYFYNPKNSVGRVIQKSVSQPLDDASSEIVRRVFRSSVFNDDIIVRGLDQVDDTFLKNAERTRVEVANRLEQQANEKLFDTSKAAKELTPGEEIIEIIQKPTRKAKAATPQKAKSAGEEIIDIIKKPTASQGPSKWTIQQQQEMLVLSQRLRKAKNADEYYAIIEEAVKKGYLDEAKFGKGFIDEVARQKELYENAVNNRLFNSIYEEVDVDGMRGYVVKNKKLLESTLDFVENQYKYLEKAGYIDVIDEFLTAEKFAQGSNTEQVLRKIFGSKKRSGIGVFNNLNEASPLFGKKFDDIFKLTPEGWVVKDQTYLQEIADVMSFSNKFDDVVDTPRWITAQERKAAEELLNVPYADDLKKLSEEYAHLSQINDEIFGIDISSKLPEGYVRHHLNNDYSVKSRAKVRDIVRRTEDSVTFNGKLNYFDSREYQMTVAEANRITKWEARRALENPALDAEAREFWKSRENQDMFSRLLSDSVMDMIKYQPELAASARKFEQSLIQAALQGEDIIRIVPDGGVGVTGTPIRQGTVTMDGYRSVTVGDIRKKLQGFAKYLDNPAEFDVFVQKFLTDTNGRALADGSLALIDVNVFDIIGTDWKKASIEMLDWMAKVTNTFNNQFKRLKIFSPGMQMRNIIGNFVNMKLAGMPILDILNNTIRSVGVLKQGPEVLKKAMTQGLTSLTDAEKITYNFYIEFISNNFDQAALGVQNIDEIVGLAQEANKNLDQPALLRMFNNLLEWNGKVNTTVDSHYRMSMLMWAMENPDVVTSRGLRDAGDMVRQALFDPNDLTSMEKSFFKRIIPFYTFTKKNLAHQMRSAVERPGEYSSVIRAYNATWDLAGIDKDDVADYKTEQLWVPIPGMKKNGEYVLLKVNLPMEELAESIESPFNKLMSSLSPALRAAPEGIANNQTFTGRPIQDYKGQRSYTFDGVPGLENLPRWVDYAISSTGLDVPLAPVTSLLVAINKLFKGEDSSNIPGEFITGALRSVVNVGDLESDRRSRDYDKLDELQDLVRYYKDRGIQIKTIPEIENENKRMRDLDIRIKVFTGR